mgnify:CR=1 FL=1
MKQFAYVGCRTTKERNARGKGISCYEIDNNKICSNLKCKKLLTNSVIFPIITTLVALIM